jgi:drug/metabolite transporter (DMT)-like permease
MVHLLALLGVLSISFSAVFIRLASVSPVTAVFYRAIYAIPMLAVLALRSRGRDARGDRVRRLAVISGLILALDLAFWHESIALVGAGLGTVVANVQVVFVAVLGWAFYRERPTARAWVLMAGILTGLALTSGLSRPEAYGTSPVLGVVFGLLAGGCYAAYLLVFRAANRAPGPREGALLEATSGMAVGALLVAPFDAHFSFAASWPAHGWLVLLAAVSQVLGWLLIVEALSALPALETSILLLIQPVFALIWGRWFFDEHLSMLQWAGTLLVLGGVGAMSTGRVTRSADASVSRLASRSASS